MATKSMEFYFSKFTLSKSDIKAVKKKLINSANLEKLAACLTLVGNSTRLKIILLINELKELCVNDISKFLDISVSAVSQHLSKLKAHGLVKSRKRSQTVFYSLSDHSFLNTLVEKFLERFKKNFKKYFNQ